VSMHRSTRLRRLIVAFLVVLVLAVAVRFARATGSDGVAEAQRPGRVMPPTPVVHFVTSPATNGLPGR
jgi:hypothetical protein